MNLRRPSFSFGRLAFRGFRSAMRFLPGGRISAFGGSEHQISRILVVNLDRQPRRLLRLREELSRFRASDGSPLSGLLQRFPAVDARDGRAVAATPDVDQIYRLSDQLYVQPDRRLEACFEPDEQIRMTRQEVAVARSHIEVWKTIASGSNNCVLVLEDDVWFRPGAASLIENGWNAALGRFNGLAPDLLYLSYSDADGTAERADTSKWLFRPVRGLWFLSGYVLSRDGAARLLRAMPVVGPVDLWINYRFKELRALALSTPAILQRSDVDSSNSYSILPYLARAGIVNAGTEPPGPDRSPSSPVLAWTAGCHEGGLAMALSMLGLRVRTFHPGNAPLSASELAQELLTFDALVNAALTQSAVQHLDAVEDARFVIQRPAGQRSKLVPPKLPAARTAVLHLDQAGRQGWKDLCSFLDLQAPAERFPAGPPSGDKVFRDERPKKASTAPRKARYSSVLDPSPWVLPARSNWRPSASPSRLPRKPDQRPVYVGRNGDGPFFRTLTETFPGNRALFDREGVSHSPSGTRLLAKKQASETRSFKSGAFSSFRDLEYGRFGADIKAARGAGLITGFFLHRSSPRQEIDIELPGRNPRRMLVNVYFNPGDEGAAFNYGYRGSACQVDLDFDTTQSFHRYEIDWSPDRISWIVDGEIVHERYSWDPTPIPHLAMRLHANLWLPHSIELAGEIREETLPTEASFRNLSIYSYQREHSDSRRPFYEH